MKLIVYIELYFYIQEEKTRRGSYASYTSREIEFNVNDRTITGHHCIISQLEFVSRVLELEVNLSLGISFVFCCLAIEFPQGISCGDGHKRENRGGFRQQCPQRTNEHDPEPAMHIAHTKPRNYNHDSRQAAKVIPQTMG